MQHYKNACAGIPYRAAGCFLKVRKAKMSVTVSLPRSLLGNATIQNACTGIPYPAAGSFLKARKAKMSATISLPCRLLGSSSIIQNACADIPYRAAGCFLKVRKAKMSVTVSLSCRLVGNATMKNACAGNSWYAVYRAAGCFLKARKAKTSVTVSLPCRLLGNATIQKYMCRYSVPCSRLLSERHTSCYQHTHFSLSHFQPTCTIRKLSRSFWLFVLSESSTKSQNERDSFLTVQVAWKCGNTKMRVPVFRTVQQAAF